MKVASLIIQPDVPEPIYRQIVEQIRRFVLSGQLAPGEGIPSVREVAGFHAVNPMTVSRAYSLLEAEGVLERVRGKGMVAAAGARSPEQRLALLERPMHDLARQAAELELPPALVLARLQRLMET
jgi:GntR family transcriptional regulator